MTKPNSLPNLPDIILDKVIVCRLEIVFTLLFYISYNHYYYCQIILTKIRPILLDGIKLFAQICNYTIVNGNSFLFHHSGDVLFLHIMYNDIRPDLTHAGKNIQICIYFYA